MKKIKHIFKIIFEYIILFFIGGIAYYFIERLWKGYFPHFSMFIVGGIAFILLGFINSRYLEWKMPLVEQMFIAGFVITVVELFAGLILNIWLKLNIWDYSNIPYNFLGQICLSYFALWQFLSPVGIILHDIVCWKLFNDKAPTYNII